MRMETQNALSPCFSCLGIPHVSPALINFKVLRDSAWRKPVIVQNIKTLKCLLLPGFIQILLIEVAFRSCCCLILYWSFLGIRNLHHHSHYLAFSIGICKLFSSTHHSTPVNWIIRQGLHCMISYVKGQVHLHPLHPHPKAHCSDSWHSTTHLWRHFTKVFFKIVPEFGPTYFLFRSYGIW